MDCQEPLVKVEKTTHSIDCTHSQTSSVQNSLSLQSESGNPHSEFEPWDLDVDDEESNPRVFRPWKGGWLQTKKWTKLADEDIRVLNKTKLSDYDGESVSVRKTTPGLLGVHFIRKPSLKVKEPVVPRSPKRPDMRAQHTNAINTKNTARFFLQLLEKTKPKGCVSGEPNVSGTDEEDVIPTEMPASDSTNDKPNGESLRLAQGLFESASRVLDKELLAIEKIDSKAVSAQKMIPPYQSNSEEEFEDQKMIYLIQDESPGTTATVKTNTKPNNKKVARSPVWSVPFQNVGAKRNHVVYYEEDETIGNNPPPPVLEIAHHDRGDQSVSPSELSSLSGSIHLPLQFSLGTGFKGNNKQLIAMVAEIVKSLEKNEGRKTATSSRCLILLMDPSKRIFEIVQVPYIMESTTIGEILARLPIVATDRRLARVKFSGFSCKGILFSASMVPVQLVLEAAQSRVRPIFAVPEGYSPEQIDALGNSLLRSPHVAKLLHDKLANARHESDSSKTSKPSKHSATKTTSSNIVPSSSTRRYPRASLGVITED